jgi:hypothetical protein
VTSPSAIALRTVSSTAIAAIPLGFGLVAASGRAQAASFEVDN